MTGEARDDDRKLAIALVKSACASGQIVQADADMRIDQLKSAQTIDEIRMHTRDLMPAEPQPVEPAAPAVGYGPPLSASPDEQLKQAAAAGYLSLDDLKPKVSATKIIVPLAIVLVIAVVAIGGVLALVGSSIKDSLDDVSSGAAKEDVDVLSAGGYQDLLDAINEQTGSTEAYSAALYPTYAVVELPVDRTSQREEYWYWDGSELTLSSKSKSTWERTDLSKVNPAVVANMVDQVRGKVDEATTWYAIVRAPDADRAVIWAYATNDYNETAYLGARRDGTVTYDSTEH